MEKLPVVTAPSTLERGKPLLITTSGAGGGLTSAPMRMNYVRIKVSDVIRNVKIVVHSVYLPFPHINPVAAAYDSILGGSEVSGGDQTMEGTCAALDGHGPFVEDKRNDDWKHEPFDFLIDGELVRMSLEDFLLAKGISAVYLFFFPKSP
uniref:NLE domain-containing protein n=1 Tax=Lactuca sativa TaxID=4236 RepID=A0A9R1VL52_LACSA|nr:hypothetical protein LSAT_V11C500278170 [Lactuca sativa]